ncbi:MAG: hypothetical protein ACXV3C_12460, partial [Actinomycetes bacterium]
RRGRRRRVRPRSRQVAYRGLVPDSYLVGLRRERRFEVWSNELRAPTLPSPLRAARIRPRRGQAHPRGRRPGLEEMR